MAEIETDARLLGSRVSHVQPSVSHSGRAASVSPDAAPQAEKLDPLALWTLYDAFVRSSDPVDAPAEWALRKERAVALHRALNRRLEAPSAHLPVETRRYFEDFQRRLASWRELAKGIEGLRTQWNPATARKLAEQYLESVPSSDAEHAEWIDALESALSTLSANLKDQGYAEHVLRSLQSSREFVAAVTRDQLAKFHDRHKDAAGDQERLATKSGRYAAGFIGLFLVLAIAALIIFGIRGGAAGATLSGLDVLCVVTVMFVLALLGWLVVTLLGWHKAHSRNAQHEHACAARVGLAEARMLAGDFEGALWLLEGPFVGYEELSAGR